MPFSPTRPVILVLGLVLLVAFSALATAMKLYVASTRFIATGDLLDELADAEFLDEPVPPNADWPQWRGPRRDGVTTMSNLLRDWPEEGPPRAWQKRTGDSYSSFAIANGRVFTMLGQGEREAVACFDLATGNEHWRQSYTPERTFDYGGPRATPTVVGNRVYAASPGGLLMCLHAQTGDFIWQRDLVATLDADPPRWGFACSPLVEGDRVYLIVGGRGGQSLAAFDRVSGDLAWAGESDKGSYSSPVAATIAGLRQVVFLTARRLIGVEPRDGTVLWEYPWSAPFEVNAATPLVCQTRRGSSLSTYVFISSGYDRGCALVKVEGRGGSFRARRVYETDALCCHFSTPVRRGAYLYGLDEKRDLTCLDLRTGEVAWRFDREAQPEGLPQVGFKKGSLIRVDDLLVLLGEDGKLALVEASPDAYRELVAARPFRDRCWALPALAGGRLMLRDRRQILCLDLRQGSGQD